MLRLATSLQWPPFGYKSESGGPVGLDIDLISVLAEKLGLELESAIEDGSYLKILEKYGAQDGALTIEELRNPPES